jgi:2'-5' RNA ligase
MSATRRLFIGLRPPSAVASALHAEAARALASLPHRALRFAAAQDLHLTLVFLGDTAEDLIPELGQALARAALDRPELALEIRGTGAFPSLSRPRVLWAGVRAARDRDASLDELHSGIVRAVSSTGFALAPRETAEPFRPHITVARVRFALREALPSAFADLAFHAAWRASEIVLFESRLDAPAERYPALGAWPLAATA